MVRSHHARSGNCTKLLFRQLTFSLGSARGRVAFGSPTGVGYACRGLESQRSVIVSLSLLIPWNVVGTIWQIFGRADIGLMGLHCRGWVLITAIPEIHCMRG